MKNRIINFIILTFTVLVLCVPQKVTAQGFQEPAEHTTVLKPCDSNIYTDFIIYELDIRGNQSTNVAERAWLKNISGDITWTGKPWVLSNFKVSLLGKYDTLYYYGDIFWGQSSSINIPPNFPLGSKFVKLRITANINTSDIELGDKLNVDISLDMGLGGSEPIYYYPEIQTLVYGKAGSIGINNPKSNQIIYPNPFSDQINLLNFNEKEIVTLTNSIGQIVYTGYPSDSDSIETSNLIRGVYFLYTNNLVYKLVKN